MSITIVDGLLTTQYGDTVRVVEIGAVVLHPCKPFGEVNFVAVYLKGGGCIEVADSKERELMVLAREVIRLAIVNSSK